MWDLSKANPFGRLSIRSILMLAATLFVAIFAYSILLAPTAHAADAQWNGDSIMYNQKEYVKIDNAKAGDSHKLPVDTQIYRYIEPSPSGANTPTTKAHLIYFAPGVDPPTAKSASYAVYTFTPPSTYSSPSAAATISLDEKSPASEGTTSCAVDGVGWFICPAAKFLASAMDHLFDIIASFLTVRPMQTNQDNALYRAWSYMRNFANVSFVIAFIIIIYAQITTIGLSNYDIKKILPRLIVAAILVNISYWICAIAIDASNILGWSIQEIFISVRNGLVGAEGNNWDNLLSWESITGAVLSGGAGATAAGFAGLGLLISTGGSIAGALYMLLPVLVGVIVAILVALLVMAARQAIITVLVIVSPLAFVAYLLPNTEKYFEKWHQLGLTMLILFPIFSVVFGGSQLAGMAIIQNADSINTIILGMGVQVAPVVITPLLVRFSGSLLARIGGIVNNPGKGLIDRTRKFADERRDQHKAKVLAKPLNRRRDGLARLGRRVDYGRRKREGNMKANQALGDANWAGTQEYSNIQQKLFDAKALQTIGDNNAETRYEAAKRASAEAQNLEFNARASKLRLDLSKARVDADWSEVQAGSDRTLITPSGLASDALRRYREENAAFADDIQRDTIQSEITKRRTESAHHVQQHEFAHALEASRELREQAGGIDANGAQRALAHALKEQHSARSEAVENANSIIYHSNLSADQTLAVAQGVATAGLEITEDIQEAAIKMVASSGHVGNINKLMESLDLDPSSNENHRVAFVAALSKNSAARPKYVSFGKMDQMQQGIPGGLGPAGVDAMIRDTITEGKFAPDIIVQQDKDALVRVAQALQRDAASYPPAVLAAFRSQIKGVYESDILKTRIGERDKPLQTILAEIDRILP